MAELQKAGVQMVIGLMSGTSLDGIDAALLETDGEDFVRPGASLTIPYDAEMRARLKAALEAARETADGAPVPDSIRETDRLLTEAHAAAVKALLEKTGLAPRDIALIGFHGQTILHRPERRRTWQIGDGAALAKLTGIDVVNDFRSADMRAGGQGAPLMPLYHAVLAKGGRGIEMPVAVVNIGGVAQVTYIDGTMVIAFDTGPGNAPLDDWMHAHAGTPLDRDGAFARTGSIDQIALVRLLDKPFFDRAPPKSLDRMDFVTDTVKELSPEDGAATLTAFTAASIARANEHFPRAPANWIICGGGRHNKMLMEMFVARTDAPMLMAEDVGWNGDALEAEGFAYLAMRSKRTLPLSLPSTTGVKQPTTGGTLHSAG